MDSKTSDHFRYCPLHVYSSPGKQDAHVEKNKKRKRTSCICESMEEFTNRKNREKYIDWLDDLTLAHNAEYISNMIHRDQGIVITYEGNTLFLNPTMMSPNKMSFTGTVSKIKGRANNRNRLTVSAELTFIWCSNAGLYENDTYSSFPQFKVGDYGFDEDDKVHIFFVNIVFNSICLGHV